MLRISCQNKMDGILFLRLDIGGIAKFMDLMEWHTQTLNIIIKTTGELKEGKVKDGEELLLTGCHFLNHLKESEQIETH